MVISVSIVKLPQFFLHSTMIKNYKYPSNYSNRKNVVRRFRVSVNIMSRGEYEADLSIVQFDNNSAITICPGPPGHFGSLFLTGEHIIAFEDDIDVVGVDCVELELNEPPGTILIIRFPSNIARLTFLDLIKEIR